MNRIQQSQGIGVPTLQTDVELVPVSGEVELRASLKRLLSGTYAALQTPVGDPAWQELAQVIEVEYAVLGEKIGIDEIDTMRVGILADAECIPAKVITVRVLAGNVAANAQRVALELCHGMRSKIERLLFKLQDRRAGHVGTASTPGR